MAVIGGGAIGCEFASTFADLGAEVTILEGLPKILPGLDADVTKIVERSFKKKKITTKTGVQVTGHTPNGSGRHQRRSSVTVSRSTSMRASCRSVAGRSPTSSASTGTGVQVDERGFVVGRRVLPDR